MKVFFLKVGIYKDNSPFNHLLGDIYEEMRANGIKVYRVISVNKGQIAKDVIPVENDTPGFSYDTMTVPKTNNKSFVFRYVRSLIVIFLACRKGLKNKDINTLFVISPQTAIIPVMFSVVKHKKLVLLLQDIWPNNASEIGAIRNNGFFDRIFTCIQRYVYKKADAIITISEDMKRTIANAGCASEKIFVAHNWSYLDELVSINWSDNEFVKAYNLEKGVFRVVYAGNIGALQNVEMIIHAAAILHERSDIRFAIIGEGINKKKITEMVRAQGLRNIDFYPYQTNDMATHIYAMADVNIIPLRKGAIYTALPSKTAVCLACGKPIIACIDKESSFAKTLHEYGAADVVTPDDAEELAQAIVRIKKEDDSHIKMGSAAVKYFEDYFRKAGNVSVYSKVIKAVYEASVIKINMNNS